MTSLPLLFSSAFVIGLTGAMMPGPVLTVVVAETLRRGFRAGPLIVLGHGLLEGVVLVGILAGLGGWLQRPDVLAPLSVLGGGVLIVLGAHTALGARRAVEETARASIYAQSSLRSRPILAGIVLSLSNPYWLLWWCTIGLQYAGLAARRGMVGLGVFYAGHLSSDLCWYSFVAAAVAAGRRVCPPGGYRLLLTACGLTLVALGAWFLGEGAGVVAGGRH